MSQVSATVHNKFQVIAYHRMSATVSAIIPRTVRHLYIYSMHETVRYWNNVIYMTCGSYSWKNTGSLVALWWVSPLYRVLSPAIELYLPAFCTDWASQHWGLYSQPLPASFSISPWLSPTPLNIPSFPVEAIKMTEIVYYITNFSHLWTWKLHHRKM